MIFADDALIDEYNQFTRDVCAQVIFDSPIPGHLNITLGNDEIISLTVKSTLSNSKNLTLGNIATKQLDLKIKFNSDIFDEQEENPKITVKIGIKPNGAAEYTMTQIGVFYFDSMVSNDGFRTLEITAYDAMYLLNAVDDSNPWLLITKAQQYLTSSQIQLLALFQTANTSEYLNLKPKTINRTVLRNTADKCKYNSDGTMTTDSNYDWGVNKEHLIFINGGGSSITVNIYTSALPAGTLQVCFYNNFYGDSLIDYQSATMTRENTDDGYILHTNITPPTVPCYMGFSLMSLFDQSANRYEIELEHPEHIPFNTLGAKNLDYDMLSKYTYKERVSFNAATFGANLMCTNIEEGYPGASVDTDEEGNIIINYDYYDKATFKAVPFNQTGFVIPQNMQYLDGFKTSMYEPTSIAGFITGSQDNPVKENLLGYDGIYFNFTDPLFIPDDVPSHQLIMALTQLYNIQNIMTGTVKYRGNPFVEVSDVVVVEGKDGKKYNFFVCENELRFSGGLSCTISCNIDTSLTKDAVSSRATTSITTAVNNSNATLANKVAGTLKQIWSGSMRLNATDKITLTEEIVQYPRGLLLEWKLADSGTSEPHGDSFFSFIPKYFSGNCVCGYGSADFSVNCRKQVRVSKTMIYGDSVNVDTGTESGITYANNRMVLIAVYAI